MHVLHVFCYIMQFQTTLNVSKKREQQYLRHPAQSPQVPVKRTFLGKY